MAIKRQSVFKSEEHEKFQSDLEYGFEKFCKKQNLHHCAILKEEDNEIYDGKGPSIILCYEDETGFLYAGNDEINYESVINFCPFCGYKSKKEVPFYLENQ